MKTTELPIRVIVGIDSLGWHERFATALDSFISSDIQLAYSVENLDAHDWIEKLNGCDLIFWKPMVLTPEATSNFKEKVYFMENFLKIRVMPNYQTIWHFDSKIAQSYLFKFGKIPTPRSFVSFDFFDALKSLDDYKMPVVHKKSWGAASRKVSLITNKSEAKRIINKTFFQQVWETTKSQYQSNFLHLLLNINQPWFWSKILERITKQESKRFGSIYWQEFIPNNPADLRVTVIGDQFAYVFWRNNRPNDFRASGSGRIVYDREVPLNIIEYCKDINKLLGFDSMAYDILFKGDKIVITEMSYAYSDIALFNTPGHYEFGKKKIQFKKGNVWPQQLWVEYCIQKHGLINK